MVIEVIEVVETVVVSYSSNSSSGSSSRSNSSSSSSSMLVREQDNSSTRQLIDTVFGDHSSTQLKTTHRHFLKTIHRHIIILQLYPSW